MNVKKAWNWFVWSSKDKSKLSLSLLAGVPTLVWFFAFSGHGNIDLTVTNEFVNALADFLSKTVEWGLSAITLFGVARKIWYLIFPKKEA